MTMGSQSDGTVIDSHAHWRLPSKPEDAHGPIPNDAVVSAADLVATAQSAGVDHVVHITRGVMGNDNRYSIAESALHPDHLRERRTSRPGGRSKPCHSCSRSWANFSVVRSSRYGPMAWSPSGSPAALRPLGTRVRGSAGEDRPHRIHDVQQVGEPTGRRRGVPDRPGGRSGARTDFEARSGRSARPNRRRTCAPRVARPFSPAEHCDVPGGVHGQAPRHGPEREVAALVVLGGSGAALARTLTLRRDDHQDRQVVAEIRVVIDVWHRFVHLRSGLAQERCELVDLRLHRRRRLYERQGRHDRHPKSDKRSHRAAGNSIRHRHPRRPRRRRGCRTANRDPGRCEPAAPAHP